jgi:hypothetical protein
MSFSAFGWVYVTIVRVSISWYELVGGRKDGLIQEDLGDSHIEPIPMGSRFTSG